MIPRLYAIADAGVLARHKVSLEQFAHQLCAAGGTLLQYRNKTGSPQEILRAAAVLREVMAGSSCQLIMNDRADLAVLAAFDGVHMGQSDLSPADAKRVLGSEHIVGVSTHTDEQVREANLSVADYVAIGPAFATGTKADTEPVVGLDGIHRARALTPRALVAIGGITRANARSVIDAGADSVAVISALFSPDESVEKVARDFLELLG